MLKIHPFTFTVCVSVSPLLIYEYSWVKGAGETEKERSLYKRKPQASGVATVCGCQPAPVVLAPAALSPLLALPLAGHQWHPQPAWLHRSAGRPWH